MDEVADSIKSYVDVKFAELLTEIKAVTSKTIPVDGDENPEAEPKVEITKDLAQTLVKSISE